MYQALQELPLNLSRARELIHLKGTSRRMHAVHSYSPVEEEVRQGKGMDDYRK